MPPLGAGRQFPIVSLADDMPRFSDDDRIESPAVSVIVTAACAAHKVGDVAVGRTGRLLAWDDFFGGRMVACGREQYPGELGAVFVKILAAVPAMTVREDAPFGTACGNAVDRIAEGMRPGRDRQRGQVGDPGTECVKILAAHVAVTVGLPAVFGAGRAHLGEKGQVVAGFDPDVDLVVCGIKMSVTAVARFMRFHAVGRAGGRGPVVPCAEVMAGSRESNLRDLLLVFVKGPAAPAAEIVCETAVFGTGGFRPLTEPQIVGGREDGILNDLVVAVEDKGAVTAGIMACRSVSGTGGRNLVDPVAVDMRRSGDHQGFQLIPVGIEMQTAIHTVLVPHGAAFGFGGGHFGDEVGIDVSRGGEGRVGDRRTVRVKEQTADRTAVGVHGPVFGAGGGFSGDEIGFVPHGKGQIRQFAFVRVKISVTGRALIVRLDAVGRAGGGDFGDQAAPDMTGRGNGQRHIGQFMLFRVKILVTGRTLIVRPDAGGRTGGGDFGDQTAVVVPRGFDGFLLGRVTAGAGAGADPVGLTGRRLRDLPFAEFVGLVLLFTARKSADGKNAQDKNGGNA